MKLSLALLTAGVLLGGLAAQSPVARLLVDIDQPVFAPEIRSGFERLGTWSYFVASIDGSDRLYRTGGTPSSTGLFLDPGQGATEAVRIDDLTATGNRLFFHVDGAGPARLWVSDGTPAGTRALRIHADGTRVRWAAPFGNKLFFIGTRAGTQDMEPWISDGTSAGTFRLADTVPGPLGGWPSPRFGAVVPGVNGGADRFWFRGSLGSGAPGLEFWSTDGTVVGTRLEASLLRGNPGRPAVLGPGLLIVGVVGGRPDGDGLVALREGQGATALPTPEPVGTRNVPRDVVAFDGHAYATCLGSRMAVITDGTPAGTAAVPLHGGNKEGPSVVVEVTASAMHLAYPAADGGFGLARIDAGPTRGVATDVGPLPGVPLPADNDGIARGVRLGGRLVIGCETATARPLFAIDLATAAATELLADGVDSSPAPHSGAALIRVVEPDGGQRPYVTDGSMRGTRRLLDLQGAILPADSLPQAFTRFGTRVVFVAEREARGLQPWITDGTAAGTWALPELPARGRGLDPELEGMFEVADELWIAHVDPASPARDILIDAYDGSRTGRRRVGTLRSAAPAPSIANATAFGADLLFGGYVGGARGLYKMTTNGALTLLHASTGWIESITVMGEAAVVSFHPFPFAVGQREVWFTDGTVAGTSLLGVTATPLGSSAAVAFDDRVWLATGAGVEVADAQGLRSFPPLPAELQWVVVGDLLFGLTANAMWVTDGSTAGTRRILMAAGPTPLHGSDLAVLGDRLLFERGTELWVSDGTAAGTHFLTDTGTLHTDAWSSGSEQAWFVGGTFGIDRGLFRTDGTTAGTHRVQDLDIVRGDSLIHTLGHDAGTHLLLVVDDPEVGIEPWVFDPGASWERVGGSCAGAGTFTPALTVDADPQLGRRLTVEASVTGGRLGTLLLGPPSLRAEPIPGTRCLARVDLDGTTAIGPLPLTTGGSFRLPLALPSSPSLLGLDVAAQAVFATGRGPRGIDLTPGLLLRLGR